jgi:hypothetical protein
MKSEIDPRVMAEKEEDTCANPDRAQLGALSHHLQTQEVYHPDVHCNACGASRIYGIRYKCAVCPSFNLCERCEAHEERRTVNGHSGEHPFLKIRTPAKEATAMGGLGDFVGIGGVGTIADNFQWK